jgi:hypothetical protein
VDNINMNLEETGWDDDCVYLATIGKRRGLFMDLVLVLCVCVCVWNLASYFRAEHRLKLKENTHVDSQQKGEGIEKITP